MGGSAFGLYYLICGLGGAIFSFVVSLFTPVMPFVGASAAVFGVSLAFAMHWPDAPIFVFPLPIPIKAKWLVIFLATTNLVFAVSGANDGVAHLAHLGGFLFGFIYLKSEEVVIRRARNAIHRRRQPTRVLAHSPRAPKETPAEEEPSPQSSRDALYDEVDRVLDKISASGMQSLTPEERRLLDQVSRELREH